MRLLLVEDSVRLRELLTERVHDAGWRLDAVATAAEAEAATRSVAYDLALLDLGLPDRDGIALIRELRKGGFAAPILVITARGAVDDRVAALDSGADDYLVKPFNHTELLARCRALLRRRSSAVVELFEVAGISFDPALGIVRIAGEALSMAPRERSVLELLLRNAGRVVAKEQIEVALSEFGGEISTNAVELAVSRLRRRLAPSQSGVAIETIRGVGYLLREAKPYG
jgi:two-component system, OmpR family, response regulator